MKSRFRLFSQLLSWELRILILCKILPCLSIILSSIICKFVLNYGLKIFHEYIVHWCVFSSLWNQIPLLLLLYSCHILPLFNCIPRTNQQSKDRSFRSKFPYQMTNTQLLKNFGVKFFQFTMKDLTMLQVRNCNNWFNMRPENGQYLL